MLEPTITENYSRGKRVFLPQILKQKNEDESFGRETGIRDLEAQFTLAVKDRMDLRK